MRLKRNDASEKEVGILTSRSKDWQKRDCMQTSASAIFDHEPVVQVLNPPVVVIVRLLHRRTKRLFLPLFSFFAIENGVWRLFMLIDFYDDGYRVSHLTRHTTRSHTHTKTRRHTRIEWLARVCCHWQTF